MRSRERPAATCRRAGMLGGARDGHVRARRVVWAAGAAGATGPSGAVTISDDFAAVGGLSFDPKLSVTGLDGYLQHMVMGGLFWYNEDGSLRPDLASGYSVVSPTVLEVTLRPDLKFQDGSPLTATEVKANVERSATSTGTAIRTLTKY